MIAPLLAVALSTAPAQAFWLTDSPRHARLLHRTTVLTQDQIENYPVSELTVTQLMSEDLRLSSPPSILPSAIMLGVGGGVFVGFGLLTWFLGYQASIARGWDVLGWVFLAIISGIVTAAGGVVAIVGGVILPTKLAQRADYAARKEQVDARLIAIRAGEATAPPETYDAPAQQSEVLQLEADKPGLGLPIGLMCGGAGALGIGIYSWTQYARSTSPTGGGLISTGLIFPIAFIVAGIAMEGLGIYFLITRIQKREEIDADIKQRQRSPGDMPGPMVPPPPPPAQPDAPLPPPPPPPVMAQLPAPPVLIGYTWQF